ncbi:TPA: hypothetical protein L6A07_24910 [Pseudomonas aeruginosa]|nr:hypothetical protein B382_19375 [Stutzerimonas stutzeri B1SMN1]HBP6378430.1 hypothetical protein [Pseudomonas aeruginosa]
MNTSTHHNSRGGVAAYFTAAITIALTGMVLLTILTMIATDNSRSRADCLRSAQAIEQCPQASWWEGVLRKGVGL